MMEYICGWINFVFVGDLQRDCKMVPVKAWGRQAVKEPEARSPFGGPKAPPGALPALAGHREEQ